MSIRLKVYINGDHTCLVWLPDDGKPIPDWPRIFPSAASPRGSRLTCMALSAFRHRQDRPQESWKFPVQRFMLVDYSVRPGDTVQYSVVPVGGCPARPALARRRQTPAR